jgi:tetratricopeptide (TPR) repeat protein
MIHRNPAFQRAMILQQQHRYADAANELRQVLASDPHDAIAHAMLALCLFEQEKLKEATAEAQEAVGLAPDLPLAHYALGFVLFKRNWLDEALTSAREACQLDSFEPNHFALIAAIEMERRNWPGALDQAGNALAIDPDHTWATNLRAMALVKLGRRSEAAATMGEALSRDPENAISHANQGWTMLNAGDHRQAMIHFREALRLDPTQGWAKAGMVEALKSSFFLYRWLLMFFLWMGRLSSRAQWGVVIGAWFAYQVLRNVANRNPSLAPFLWPILWTYIAFVAMTWLAYPLFNLVLRLHRYGRYALAREQILGANSIGLVLALALTFLGVGLWRGNEMLIVAALHCALLIIPVAGAFTCPAGWPRNVMLAAAGLLALVSVAYLVLSQRAVARNDEPALDDLTPLLFLFMFGILASSFATNALAKVKPRQ